MRASAEPTMQRRHEAMSPLRPGYARFLTIMAFHVFLRERVDAAIVEVGIGGTYDATNVVPQPLATGVSALGYDHTAILGKTLTEIAHQKAGIFKVRSALSSPSLIVCRPACPQCRSSSPRRALGCSRSAPSS